MEATARSTLVPELLRVAQVRREIEGVFSLRLDLRGRAGAAGFGFAPGQFNMLYQLGVGEVAISISGDPGRPNELWHTVRAVGTVTRAMQGASRGDVVGVRGPYGNPWPMDEARGKDLVIVAGGVGLAPLRPAILHALAHRDQYGRLIVLYGARSPAEILFRKDLERWRGRLDTVVEVTVDRAPVEWPGAVGVVPALVRPARFDPANAVAMLCGPEVMMRFTVRELELRGLAHDRIHVSMERNMKCGAGLCGHCQYGPSFVCKDGPVFRFDRVERLFQLREI